MADDFRGRVRFDRDPDDAGPDAIGPGRFGATARPAPEAGRVRCGVCRQWFDRDGVYRPGADLIVCPGCKVGGR